MMALSGRCHHLERVRRHQAAAAEANYPPLVLEVPDRPADCYFSVMSRGVGNLGDEGIRLGSRSAQHVDLGADSEPLEVDADVGRLVEHITPGAEPQLLGFG